MSRRSFLASLVYLQTGSLGPTPRPVRERVLDAWTKLELNPTLYGYGELETDMDEVRARAGAFLRRQGVVLDVVAIPPDEHDARAIVSRFEKAITPRTRVLSFAHLLSSTGLRMPVAALCALARAHGCTAVVDGAQATGGVAVDVKALDCHVYATSGHKWLLGPKGTGLPYPSAELGSSVEPIALEGGRAAYSDSSGFRYLPGLIGLGAAIDCVSSLGIARIEAHNLALRQVPWLRPSSPTLFPTTSTAGPSSSRCWSATTSC